MRFRCQELHAWKRNGCHSCSPNGSLISIRLPVITRAEAGMWPLFLRASQGSTWLLLLCTMGATFFLSSLFSRIDTSAYFHPEILCPGVGLLRLYPKMQTFPPLHAEQHLLSLQTRAAPHPASCPPGSLQPHSEFPLSTFPF